jgi:hypothetical protein
MNKKPPTKILPARVEMSLYHATVARAQRDSVPTQAIVIAALEQYLGLAPLRDHTDDPPGVTTGARVLRSIFGRGGDD